MEDRDPKEGGSSFARSLFALVRDRTLSRRTLSRGVRPLSVAEDERPAVHVLLSTEDSLR